MADRVCVGRVIAAHGVRGLVKLKSFTENPRDLTAYGPLSDEAGTVLKVELLSGGKEEFIARIEGVTDRTGAEPYKGRMLYVDRDALPAPESSEYYHADLVGLTVLAHDGRHLGTVSALHNFGAGDILEIANQHGDTILLPFSHAFVPVIDFANKQITLADYDEIS